MEPCNILDLIKKLDIEKQRAFSLEDLLSLGECNPDEAEKQLESYVKLSIILELSDGLYRVGDMCMLSQF